VEAPAGGTRISNLAHHTISGLTNPQASTLPEHERRIGEALQSAWDHPFGRGLGQQTLGLQKQTGKLVAGVDNDIAAAFEILGFPAGVLFLAFMVAAFGQAFRKYIRRPSSTSLFVVGILVTFLTGWWVGQMYSASMLLWLVLGTLSRPPEDSQKEPSPLLSPATSAR
jgi:O-antigen ligase